MSRTRNVWLALLGRLPDEYVLRSEVPMLEAKVSELDISISDACQKLDAAAQRLRVRQDRIDRKQAEAQPTEDPQGALALPSANDRAAMKAQLRRQAAVIRHHNGQA